MTNEEAIKIIQNECYISDLLNLDRTRIVNSALDMAIKALESQADTEYIGFSCPRCGYVCITRRDENDK